MANSRLFFWSDAARLPSQNKRFRWITTTEFTSETEAEPTPPEAPRLLTRALPSQLMKKEHLFSLGSNTISQQEKTKLLDVADRLKNDRKVLVRLIGYAKDNGSRSSTWPWLTHGRVCRFGP